jgi:hypothetical protein
MSTPNCTIVVVDDRNATQTHVFEWRVLFQKSLALREAFRSQLLWRYCAAFAEHVLDLRFQLLDSRDTEIVHQVLNVGIGFVFI